MYIAVAIDDDKSVSTFHGIILPKCLSTSDAGVPADSVRPVQKRGRGVEVWRGGGAAAAGARLWLLNGHRWDGIIAQPFQFPAFNGRSSSLERTHCGRPKPARGPGLRRSDPAQAAAYPNTRAPSIPPFRALGQGPPSCPATRTRTVIKYNQRARSPHAQGPAVPGNPHEMERSDVVSPGRGSRGLAFRAESSSPAWHFSAFYQWTPLPLLRPSLGHSPFTRVRPRSRAAL